MVIYNLRYYGRDETPMVRRAAAHKLGRFAEVVEPPYISRELIPSFQDLTQDGTAAPFPQMYLSGSHMNVLVRSG